MRPRKPDARPRKTSRRWHIPPPLVHGPEALEGGNVLQEFPGELGVVLWQALRDVMLYAMTPPADRGQLFSEDAHRGRVAALMTAPFEPLLEAPFRTLTQLVGDPAGTPPEVVAAACRQVSQWAEARRYLQTALAFAQSAALVCPADPALAMAVGSLAYWTSDQPRAEVWYRRTIGLARQARDWFFYARGFHGLGFLYTLRGNFPAARRYRLRALRAAKRGGLRHLQATSLHDLFSLEAECGNRVEAERYAREALGLYGPKSSRLPTLANDIAYFWLLNGRFAAALKVLRPLVAQMEEDDDLLMMLGSVARAAGGAGDAQAYAEAAAAIRALASDPGLVPKLPEAYLDLAHGASSLSAWDDAATAAEAALRIATQIGAAKSMFTAESLLDLVRRRRVLASAPGTEEDPATGELASELVDCLLERALSVA